ncbi:MAG: biotin--[acetyl-CoA-carboxylase] ligase [Clostridium sp.]
MAIDGSEHLTLIAAEEQRAGRGRFGRPFYSPSRAGIYMSLLLRMPQQLSDASMITIYAAVAVQRALKQLYQTDTQIKWVNDIFYQGKSCAGFFARPSVILKAADWRPSLSESVLIPLL